MRVNIVNRQNFEAEKFRIPIKNLETKWGFIETDCYREYDNPRAEELYNLAKKETDLKKKIDLLDAMGDYRIVDKRVEKIVKKFLNSCRLNIA